jgi:hypothetical protein
MLARVGGFTYRHIPSSTTLPTPYPRQPRPWRYAFPPALASNPAASYLLGFPERRARQVTPSVIVPRRPFGTHAYALSRRGAEKLLKRAAVASYHIDVVIWGMPDLELYCCAPMLAHQAFDAPSTIGAVLGGLEVKPPSPVPCTLRPVPFAVYPSPCSLRPVP